MLPILFRRIDGSSPRARGTQEGTMAIDPTVRFIPAGAGNTLSGVDVDRCNAVHPRGRGEHASSAACSAASVGSSPRARGTLDLAPLWPVSERFIPAGAGNTVLILMELVMVTVHPRGRGEHETDVIPIEGSAGSSPRARGTHHVRGVEPRPARFIPAGAGNTASAVEVLQRAPVHPRGRGEHSRPRLKQYPRCGSSPRARGTRF